MTGDKKICCGIMLCQMTAILSGVAMLYLAVIVVQPAREELAAGYHRDPIMCTTVKADDITAGGKRVDCTWSTCGEWCLSKSSTPCMQIYVMARRNGSRVTLTNCKEVADESCSALDANVTLVKKCKLGECRELTGLYNCSKDGDNDCREITPAFKCNITNFNRETIVCNEEKCDERLSGVYFCQNGHCNRLDNVKHYWLDCERKCTDLKLQYINVAIFSSERLITTECLNVHSSDNNTINELNSLSDWTDKKKVLFIFCTYYRKVNGKTAAYDIHVGDCFNATLGESSRLQNMTDYMSLLEYSRELYNNSDFLIEPEESLRLSNTTTILKINHEGCVNSLVGECKAFFKTHERDGRDGMTRDRFPCYYIDPNEDVVIGKFNPDVIYMQLMITSIMPACLFVFACLCLFVCSKSVGVDDDGHLKVTLLQSSNAGVAKEPVHFDELL